MPHGKHARPAAVRAGEVELHARAAGSGAPVVFVHGGLGDYRYWEPHLDAFAEHWRAITYSRRYSFPNTNTPAVPDYSPRTDAADLIALIGALDLGPVHLVAASIGAVAAIFVAVERPELVRSLVVAEPPLLGWLADMPGGGAVWRDFEEKVWDRGAAYFRTGERERGVATFIDYFLGPDRYERLPSRVRTRIMQDADELEAQMLSTELFPVPAREAVAALRQPILMLGGELTRPTHTLVDAELERLLPRARRIVVPRASHDLWVDEPDACRAATIDFLRAQHPV